MGDGDGTGAVRPLIVTLAFDPASFARLDRLRRAHFPPARNLIPAHLTLFHALPGEEVAAVLADLKAAAAHPPLRLTADGVRFLGRGVALTFRCPALKRLRAELARGWAGWLGPQDRAPLAPHVTVQNKAPPHLARALHTELEGSFEPFEAVGIGLLLWRYLGGPWERLAHVPFRGEEDAGGEAIGEASRGTSPRARGLTPRTHPPTEAAPMPIPLPNQPYPSEPARPGPEPARPPEPRETPAPAPVGIPSPQPAEVPTPAEPIGIPATTPTEIPAGPMG